MKILGVLPAVGSGLDTMAKTGQLGRLMAYVGTWRGSFDEIRYFSYLPTVAEVQHIRTSSRLDWFSNRCGPERPGQIGEVLCWPNAGWWRALRRPLGGERWAWRDLSVIRCMNLLAAVPALTANAVWGIPFVVSYGADYEAIAGIHGDRGQIWKWRLLRALVFRRASAILVPSESQFEAFRRRWPRLPFRYHPNWVDAELFEPEGSDAKGLWELLHKGRTAEPLSAPDLFADHLDGGDRRVYYWGRLVAEKNLVRAARACRQAGATLCCIGDGPEESAIRAARGLVAPAIPYERLPEQARLAEAFILPSLSEGHPKALLEALALELPCLISDTVPGQWPSIRFDPFNEIQMARAIRELLSDLDRMRALGEAGRHMAIRHFDKARWLGAEVAVLREVAQ